MASKVFLCYGLRKLRKKTSFKINKYLLIEGDQLREKKQPSSSTSAACYTTDAKYVQAFPVLSAFSE